MVSRVDVSWNGMCWDSSVKGAKESHTISPMFKQMTQTDKLTSGDTHTIIICPGLITSYWRQSILYLTSNFSWTFLKKYVLSFILNESMFMTKYILNIRDKSEQNNSGNLIPNVLSMTSIWFDVKIKLPTINKYLLYWTFNWWYGERCGNGFLLSTSAVLQLWRYCSELAQKITCNIKREKSASTQNWWIGGRCWIGFLHYWFSGTLLWCQSTICKMDTTCSINWT